VPTELAWYTPLLTKEGLGVVTMRTPIMPLSLDSILTHLVTHTTTQPLPHSEISNRERAATLSHAQDATLAPIKNDERLLSSRMSNGRIKATR